ncbi:ATP-binding protein [Hydrogenophaga intermedia]|uniref:ATP-binding protein n=1 Tax=Hydrogenophaga intermedia TaxID=65786 RepID=UPI00147115DD|nr:ATP-binding protein [Hydrogenophaga intermedia]
MNTRTSGNATSASINQIDPRDGASITGENAVGKTTTLELFPLFFGTLPSQITETVGGREPMLKFVLPMPYSAIVFEYQRGNDEEHDMRCAVLRRGDNDHRPVYRFINRGFREEAFLHTNEEGRQIFCDDGQMRDAYIAMGAQCSKLLDISEYRAVILGAEARTQDAKELRRLHCGASGSTRAATKSSLTLGRLPGRRKGRGPRLRPTCRPMRRRPSKRVRCSQRRLDSWNRLRPCSTEKSTPWWPFWKSSA